jgi:hypothetical protein
LNYQDLSRYAVERVVTSGNSDRIVSLDLETKVVNGRFLSSELVLSASLSRRLRNGSIDSRVITLDEETVESEGVLFRRLDQELRAVRPLVVIGFNIGSYDLPLLTTKLVDSKGKYGDIFWAVRDCCSRSLVVDLIDPVRFELAKVDGSSPKFVSLEEVLSHPRFQKLPLARKKHLVGGGNTADKGARIYEMWKTRRSEFEEYALGDSHDVLLIFEELYLQGGQAIGQD